MQDSNNIINFPGYNPDEETRPIEMKNDAITQYAPRSEELLDKIIFYTEGSLKNRADEDRPYKTIIAIYDFLHKLKATLREETRKYE